MPACLFEDQLMALESALAQVPEHRAGVRLAGLPPLAALLHGPGPIRQIAAAALNADGLPVRAVLFDQGPGNNWSLGWHQDRTIVVKARRDTPGFGPWSVKAGFQHVAPPFSILEGMITLRIHLDPVSESNAPLMMVPGSHRLGMISEADVNRVSLAGPTDVCLAQRGDVWVYATPIVHASKVAADPKRRRVLQIDYSTMSLPGGLEWLDV